MDIKLDKQKERIVITGDEEIKFVEDILNEHHVDYEKVWASKTTGTILNSEPLVDKYFNRAYVINIDSNTNRYITFALYIIKEMIESISKIKLEEEKDDKDK